MAIGKSISRTRPSLEKPWRSCWGALASDGNPMSNGGRCKQPLRHDKFSHTRCGKGVSPLPVAATPGSGCPLVHHGRRCFCIHLFSTCWPNLPPQFVAPLILYLGKCLCTSPLLAIRKPRTFFSMLAGQHVSSLEGDM